MYQCSFLCAFEKKKVLTRMQLKVKGRYYQHKLLMVYTYFISNNRQKTKKTVYPLGYMFKIRNKLVFAFKMYNILLLFIFFHLFNFFFLYCLYIFYLSPSSRKVSKCLLQILLDQEQKNNCR